MTVNHEPPQNTDAVHAVLLSIGDELVLGQTVDTNTAWLAQRLARRGIACVRHETVADDRALIAAALRRAARDARLVLVSGGLGPTADDLTREALADAMGVSLELHEPSLNQLLKFFKRLDKPMPERNRVQAMCPIGATMIPNAHGTAPGIHAELKDEERETSTHVFVTPGVPREMKGMFDDAIEPRMQAFTGSADTLLTAKVNTFGLGESDVAQKLGDLMARDRNPTVGTTVSDGLCSVRIRVRHADPATAARLRDETIAHVEAALGAVCFGHDEDTLQSALIKSLHDKGKTLATAESCTGGLLGSLITDVPGSSNVYAGGWVTYSNAMKTSQLGVDPGLIEKHGAVSPAVAEAMAQGARTRSGADFALSLTGVAGPGGGTEEKPVGTVWIGLATPEGVTPYLAKLTGNRAAVRDRAAKCAMQLLRLTLLGQDPLQVRWVTKPDASDTLAS